MPTLESLYSVVRPRLPAPLVSQPNQERLARLCGLLPSASQSGFEIRLGESQDQVDFGMVAFAEKMEPLADRFIPAFARFPGPRWGRLSSFLQQTARDSAAFGLRQIYFEFDLNPGTDEVPIPSLFVKFQKDREAEWEQVAAQLLGYPFSSRVSTNVGKLLPQLKEHGVFNYIGLMLSREVEILRLHFSPRETLSALKAICWPGDLPMVEECLSELAPGAFSIHLNLDCGEALLPTVGIEILSLGTQDVWETMLERWVERGFCSETKANALRSWPGREPLELPGAKSQLELARKINHFKLVVDSEGCVQAKVYLAFEARSTRRSLPRRVKRARKLEPVMPQHSFQFPADHSPHLESDTEWWHLTGNLSDSTGRQFAYQWTLFRMKLQGKHERRSLHWTLCDPENNHFKPQESALATPPAGAIDSDVLFGPGEWRLTFLPGDQFEISGQTDSDTLSLSFQSLKPPVLHGESGICYRSKDRTRGSYHYSLSRLATRGTLRIGEAGYEVEGLSLLDREWGDNLLAEGQIGWEWFYLQLETGVELMFLNRRLESGVREFESGSLIHEDGVLENLEPHDYHFEPVQEWLSKQTGNSYPVGWTLSIPKLELEMRVSPLLSNQELPFSSLRYWEGAMRGEGIQAGMSVQAKGFLEVVPRAKV